MVKHITPDLAELLGIMIGDGHISWRKRGKWIVIVSNLSTDKNHIKNRVYNLFKREFKIEPKIRENKKDNSIRLFVYSKEITENFVDLGLPKNKKLDYIKIPKFIFKNKFLLINCLRGIFDTDGSIYRKYGQYAQVGFRSHSKKLLEDIKRGLNVLDFNPSIDGIGYVFIHRQLEIIKFFKLIGSANPKHIVRYLIWRTNYEVPKVNTIIKKISSFQQELPYVDLENKKHHFNSVFCK